MVIMTDNENADFPSGFIMQTAPEHWHLSMLL